MRVRTIASAVLGLTLGATAAHATDTLFQQYNGNVGVSTSGWGSVNSSGTISTEVVPVGSTVIAAYLYSSTYSFGSPITPGGTLGGTAVNYSTPLGLNSSACCNLQAWRADVTSIVAPVVNAGAGGAYSFNITETNSANQDGEALVVVYSNAALATQTIGILNGFASSAGDHSSISFLNPLHPSSSGFFAHMIIGDGFSCCNQMSTISVNGQQMTTAAGNNDSSVDATLSNGNLITVGNMAGPYTGGTPGFPQTSYAADHESYDLAPFVKDGDTAINIDTVNASLNDNIFLEVFDVSGVGVIHSGAPEPAAWITMLLGLGGLGVALRFRRRHAGAIA